MVVYASDRIVLCGRGSTPSAQRAGFDSRQGHHRGGRHV